MYVMNVQCFNVTYYVIFISIALCIYLMMVFSGFVSCLYILLREVNFSFYIIIFVILKIPLRMLLFLFYELDVNGSFLILICIVLLSNHSLIRSRFKSII